MLTKEMSGLDTPPPTPNPFEHDSEDEMEEMIEIGDADEILEMLEDDDDSGLEEHFQSLNDVVSRGMEEDDTDEENMEKTLNYELNPHLLEFKKHSDSIFVCDIEKSSGNLAVTGGQDDMAYVWNITTGEICMKCDGHKDSVTLAYFSSDSKYLATADMSGGVFVWSSSSLNKILEFEVEDILWLKWHPKANVLFVGVVGGCVYFWEIPSQKCKVIPGNGSDTGTAVILPDGLRIAIGFHDGSVKLVNLKDISVLYTIKTPENCTYEVGPILSMDAHPNNNLVAYGDENGNLVLFQSQGGKLISSGIGSDKNVKAIESILFLKKTTVLNILALGSSSGDIILWDYSKQIPRKHLEMDGGIVKILFNEDESLLLAATITGQVVIAGVLDGTIKKIFFCHNDSILDLCILPMQSAFITVSDDHTAKVFELKFLETDSPTYALYPPIANPQNES